MELENLLLFFRQESRLKALVRIASAPSRMIMMMMIIIIIIIIIIIYCNWVVTHWQWLFYMYTKHEIGYY